MTRCDQTIGYKENGTKIKCGKLGTFNSAFGFTLCKEHLKFHIDRFHRVADLTRERKDYVPELALYDQEFTDSKPIFQGK